jgi:gamma-glutamylcyclotransferase (GGCT)/AIG2-like uncharacterized protein YtfP
MNAMADAAANDGEILVFVYGTLKRGHGNHHWLAGAHFLGEAELPDVVLHDLGPFPMAVPGEGLVRGEVYAVDAAGLARLDRLESYPRLYDRRPLPLADGRTAWVYLGQPRQVRHVSAIADGRWVGPAPGAAVRRVRRAATLLNVTQQPPVGVAPADITLVELADLVTRQGALLAELVAVGTAATMPT